MKALTAEQVKAYHYDGFLYPIDALTPAEAADYMRALERIETHIGMSLSAGEKIWRSAAYLYSKPFYDLVCDKRILDAVEDVIGPNILAYMSTFFIKEPGSPAFTAWHQDSTYFGLEPYEHVTAWVALSDASDLAGCMEVVSSQGEPRQMAHAAARLANSLNGGGQVIVEKFDDSSAVAMQLRAGQMSLHHTLCRHQSAPNRASHRRIGIGISYIPSHVHTTGSYPMPAVLVRGRNGPGNFDLLPTPTGEFEPEALRVHAEFFRRWRENYLEQEKRHEEQFSVRAA